MTFDIPLMQFVAYTSLTVASVTVATVSAILGYRQNYGWKPITILTGHGLAGIGGSDTYNATLSFEFWNRRKYPVSLSGVKVKFDAIDFKYSPDVGEWSRVGDSYFLKSVGRLEPGAHKELNFSAPFQKRSLDDLEDTATVEVTYFDPISSKYETATSTRRFNFK